MNQRANALAAIRRLSPTELEVLKSLVGGHSLRTAAERLALSLSEAAEAKAQMKQKLGAATDADAVRIAIYAGLG